MRMDAIVRGFWVCPDSAWRASRVRTQRRVAGGRIERRGRRYPCSGCGRRTSRVPSTKERTWDDLPWAAHPVTLVYRQRRVDCHRCGIRIERVEFADAKARGDPRLRQQIGVDCQSMSTSHAAVRHGVSWSKARHADKAFLADWDSQMDHQTAAPIGLDEIQRGKGQRFWTVRCRAWGGDGLATRSPHRRGLANTSQHPALEVMQSQRPSAAMHVEHHVLRSGTVRHDPLSCDVGLSARGTSSTAGPLDQPIDPLLHRAKSLDGHVLIDSRFAHTQDATKDCLADWALASVNSFGLQVGRQRHEKADTRSVRKVSETSTEVPSLACLTAMTVAEARLQAIAEPGPCTRDTRRRTAPRAHVPRTARPEPTRRTRSRIRSTRRRCRRTLPIRARAPTR